MDRAAVRLDPGAGAQHRRPAAARRPGAGDPAQEALRSDPRRQRPAVDALLAEPPVAALLAVHPRALVVRAVRATVERARANGGTAPPEGWARAVSVRAGHLAA